MIFCLYFSGIQRYATQMYNHDDSELRHTISQNYGVDVQNVAQITSHSNKNARPNTSNSEQQKNKAFSCYLILLAQSEDASLIPMRNNNASCHLDLGIQGSKSDRSNGR